MSFIGMESSQIWPLSRTPFRSWKSFVVLMLTGSVITFTTHCLRLSMANSTQPYQCTVPLKTYPICTNPTYAVGLNCGCLDHPTATPENEEFYDIFVYYGSIVNVSFNYMLWRTCVFCHFFCSILYYVFNYCSVLCKYVRIHTGAKLYTCTVDTVQAVLRGLTNSRHICWSHTMKVLDWCITFARRSLAMAVSLW